MIRNSPTFNLKNVFSAKRQPHEYRIFSYGLLAGTLLGYLCCRLPEAIDYWKARAPLRELVKEARRHPLSYEDVVKNPVAALGRPVEWLLTHPTRNRWFYRGDASMPVFWDGPPPDVAEYGRSDGDSIVAIVAKTTSQGVLLRAFFITRSKTITDDLRPTH